MSEDGIKPIMWGIDPEVLYPWTPRAFREVLEPERKEGEGDEAVFHPAKLGKAVAGAPVILLGALLEKTYLEIEASRNEYRRARARLLSEGKDADGLNVFPDDLVSRVLRESIQGLRMKGPGRKDLALSGDWAKDEVKIRRWRYELFFDIVSANAYETEEVEGFTSPQESTQV